MNKIGKTYYPSGKFHLFSLYKGVFFVGFPCSMMLGFLYGFLLQYSGFSAINIIFVIMLPLALTALTTVVQNISKSRNQTLNMLIALTLSCLAYYTSWCYFVSTQLTFSFLSLFFSPLQTLSFVAKQLFTGQIAFLTLTQKEVFIPFGVSQLLYFVEFSAFLSPLLLTVTPNIFCEKCQRFNHGVRFYTHESKPLVTTLHQETAGHYPFFKKRSFYRTKNAALATLPPSSAPIFLGEYFYSQCLSCKQNGFLSIQTLTLEHKIGQKKAKQIAVEANCPALFIDEKTTTILEEKVNMLSFASKKQH